MVPEPGPCECPWQQVLPKTYTLSPPVAELERVMDFCPMGKARRSMGQVGQSLLSSISPGDLGLESQGTARSPVAILLNLLASTTPSRDLAGSITEAYRAYGASCTPQVPWGLCPIGEVSPQLPALHPGWGTHSDPSGEAGAGGTQSSLK